jgi:hypothetical protein
MVTKKKGAAKKKLKARAPKAPSDQQRAPDLPVVPERLFVPAQEFKFGYGKRLFTKDRPIIGSDIESLKVETGYDINSIEASVGISRRGYYYELRDEFKDKQLPDISMAILIRLYEEFPRELLPFQPISWVEYLTILGVHPGEFAQLVGRAFTAGISWQEGKQPIRSVQLIIEAFWRAGVTNTSHPVYQKFLELAESELKLRSKIWLATNKEEDKYVRSQAIARLGEEQGLVALYKFNEQGTIIEALEKELAKAKRKGKALTKGQALEVIVTKVLDRHGIKKAPDTARKRRATRVVSEAEDSLIQAVDD